MAMQFFAFYVATGISLIATIAESRKHPSNPNNIRIVGGELAKIEDIPYQLSIQYIGQHICGGSIIAAKWAVSAGHCFIDEGVLVSISDMTIVTGTSFWQKGGQTHKVENVTFHPRYQSAPMYDDYDITVLKVSKPFQLGNPGINCIPLATGPTWPRTVCQVSGWGSLREGGSPAEQLHKVIVPVMAKSICQQLYADLYTIKKFMICAGYLRGGKDSCSRDSGGPLVTLKNKLGGVVSFGRGCARPGRPGVYTDVYKVRRWILSVTGPSPCTIKNDKILRYQ